MRLNMWTEEKLWGFKNTVYRLLENFKDFDKIFQKLTIGLIRVINT